jgi:hypothetical protein
LNLSLGRKAWPRWVIALALVLASVSWVTVVRQRAYVRQQAMVAQAARTQAQAESLDLTSSERQFEDIAFRYSWDEAMALGRAMHRPVLLVGFDGQLYGRC